jgi:dihydroorotase
MRTIIHHIRLVDETMDTRGALLIEGGIIQGVFAADAAGEGALREGADLVIDGRDLANRGEAALMPAFVDLHAHFREPGFPEKETLESACLAAAAGGFGTAACMANTKPVIDTLAAAEALKARGDALGIIDLYPVMALSRGMAGEELSGIAALETPRCPLPAGKTPRLLSEDGKDVASDPLFLAAFAEARRLGLPVSCHCDEGGEDAAVRRAIALGKAAGAHVHIAHVSTAEAAGMIREAKAALAAEGSAAAFRLSCEATPHHLALTEDASRALGPASHGRVNPPLRTEADRRALIAALLDGTIDAVATDHAPHSAADKAAGAPGFTGLETAFAVCLGVLGPAGIDLRRLSSLMSAAPARLLALPDRGRLAPGLRADLVIAAPGAPWTVRPEALKSRGKNTPFAGRELRGKVLLTLHRGRIVFDGR